MIVVVETHASLQINGLDAFPSRSYRFRTMCGRYDFFPSQFTVLRARFNLPKDLLLLKPCFNIAPGKDVLVIVRDGNRNVVKPMRWGLVPSWSRDLRRHRVVRPEKGANAIHFSTFREFSKHRNATSQACVNGVSPREFTVTREPILRE
jgi:SOS response associated peptidase (SRAP)